MSKDEVINRFAKRKSVIDVARNSAYSNIENLRNGNLTRNGGTNNPRSVGQATGYSNTNTEVDVNHYGGPMLSNARQGLPQRSQTNLKRYR